MHPDGVTTTAQFATAMGEQPAIVDPAHRVLPVLRVRQGALARGAVGELAVEQQPGFVGRQWL